MKNIGILEFHFHVKFLHTTMRIAKTKDTKVTVFTTEKILKRIETYIDDINKYEIVLKKPDESVNQFLSRVEKICNDRIDLLLINTIQVHTIDVMHNMKFKPKCKKILTVHMANHWFKARFGFNFKNPFRSLDATLSIYLIRSKILPMMNAVNVIYSPTKEFIQNNTNYKRPIFTIPFNFYDEKQKSTVKKDDTLRIVVPGLIEAYRRDYDLTLDVFEKLSEKYKDKLFFDLLGKPVGPAGEKIISRCRELEKKGRLTEFRELCNETDRLQKQVWKTLKRCK